MIAAFVSAGREILEIDVGNSSSVEGVSRTILVASGERIMNIYFRLPLVKETLGTALGIPFCTAWKGPRNIPNLNSSYSLLVLVTELTLG